MRCEFEDDEGWCQGEYKGFGCIKNKCAIYNKMILKDNNGKCQYLATDGKYCLKYKKFFCIGIEKCNVAKNSST